MTKTAEKICAALGRDSEEVASNSKAWYDAPSFRQSSINSYLECPANWWMVTVAGVPSPSGDAANVGTAVHAAIEAYTRNAEVSSPVPLLSEHKPLIQPDAYATAEAMLAEWWVRDDVDPKSILGIEWKFSFPLREHHFTGTADLVYRAPDGILTVRDYKTGWLQTDARASVQLRLYALVAAIEFGDPATDTVVAEYWWLRHGQRKWATFTPVDHWQTISYLTHLAKNMIEDPDPQPRPSIACAWCPACAVCPVWTEETMPEDEGSAAPVVESWVNAKERANFWTKRADLLRPLVEATVEQADGAVLDDCGRGAKFTYRSGLRYAIEDVVGTMVANYADAPACCASSVRAFARSIPDFAKIDEKKLSDYLPTVVPDLVQAIEEKAHKYRSRQLRMARGKSVPPPGEVNE